CNCEMSSFIAARSDSLAVRSVLTRLLRALIESLRVRTVRLTSSKYARCTESAAFVVACAPTTSCCSLSKSDLVAKKQPARARGRQTKRGENLVIANMSLLRDWPESATTPPVSLPWCG